MKGIKRILGIAVAAALLFWLYTVFFPSPEKLIRKRLKETATAATIVPNEGELAQALNASKLASNFGPDVTVRIYWRGQIERTVSNSDIINAAVALRQDFSELKIEFLDLNIALDDDKTTAEVDLTMRASTPRDEFFVVQEMKFTLRKIDGKWLIVAVETVRTLTLLPPRVPDFILVPT